VCCDTAGMPPPRKRREVEPPDLPELEPVTIDPGSVDGELLLDGALVERRAYEPVRARRVRITESQLRGFALERGDAPGIQLSDVILSDCDLSNVDGREGSLRRVQVLDSKLIGFGLAGGSVRDLRITDTVASFAAFSFAELRDVVFQRVDLTEASFMRARLDGVEFIDCKLDGADFRDVALRSCEMRGASLEGIVGIGSLHGLTMPWPDVLESAAAMAATLGILIEE
jgi:uncharacterized protein YjbI with pentapeptide repeats